MILASVIMLIFQIWLGVVFFWPLCALIDVLWLCDSDDAHAMVAWVEREEGWESATCIHTEEATSTRWHIRGGWARCGSS